MEKDKISLFDHKVHKKQEKVGFQVCHVCWEKDKLSFFDHKAIKYAYNLQEKVNIPNGSGVNKRKSQLSNSLY